MTYISLLIPGYHFFAIVIMDSTPLIHCQSACRFQTVCLNVRAMKKACTCTCKYPGTFLITYAACFYSNLVIDSLDGINHETNISFEFLESWQSFIVFCSSQLSKALFWWSCLQLILVLDCSGLLITEEPWIQCPTKCNLEDFAEWSFAEQLCTCSIAC